MKKTILKSLILVLGVCCFTAQAQFSHKIVENELLKLTKQNKATVKDISSWNITSEHTSSTSGIHHLYLRQVVNGLEILGTESSVHSMSDQSVFQSHISFIKDAQQKVKGTANPSITAIQAVQKAAAHLGYVIGEPLSVLQKKNTPSQETRISSSGISISDIPARLMYHRLEKDNVVLVWDLSIESITKTEWYNVRVNANTGEVVDKINWTTSCNLTHSHQEDKYFATPGFLENETPVLEEYGAILTGSYRVIAMPTESPYFGPRTLETTAVNTTASPFGWHDTDGVIGAEFTVTRGNNVNAYEDGNNSGFQPDGGPTLVFDFPFNPIFSGGNESESAAITNLFYWNNLIHDLIYIYGFDEASGNFQSNNYGNGGLGNDFVRAEAQDGSGTCNANFSTPTDGNLPRMQMFICNTQDGDFDNLVIVHEYGHGISNRLTGGAGNSGCLSGSEQMGEGWSDWYGLLMTMDASDTSTQSRAVGTYLFGQGAGGPGIRPFPYNTDMAINPQTYDHIKTAAVPHGVGSVWSTMLWEMTWGLIDVYGFDADFYNGTGGNNMALALVTEALKLQPCNPGFVDGRDAILAADVALYGGANQCTIWDAFAKRGLGVSAIQGSSASRSDGTEAFDTPSGVAAFTAPSDVCETIGVLTNLGGGTPPGGVYSGPGVTDNGNGSTFSFDPEIAGVGIHLINYEVFASACATASTASDTIEVFESLQVTNCQADIFVNADAGSCGAVITFSPPVGTSGCAAEYAENFDGVTAPSLPVGWTFTQEVGTVITWTTVNSGSNSSPNAAFANNPGSANLSSLISSPIAIASTSAQLLFKNNYQTESGFDGMVLEFTINAGTTWNDILNGGGTFSSGGYNGSLSTCCSNPLPGRAAWTGSSGGFVDTVVNLNAALDGQIVQFRWRMGSDSSVTGAGVWLDDVRVSGIFSPEPVTTQISGLASGSVFPVGTTINSFEIEDGSGNIATCTFEVTVMDNINPVAVGQNITVSLDANGLVTILPFDVDNGSSDNCSIDTMALDITNFACADLGPNTVTLTVTDGSGNSNATQVTVTVEDTLAPVLTCPANQVVQIVQGEMFTIPDYFDLGDASAIDNCTNPITNIVQSPAAGTEFPEGIYTIEITVTDASGNEVTCDFELEVEELLSIGDQTFTNQSVVLFPNPTSGEVTILNKSDEVLQSVVITDVNGRIIRIYDLSAMENQSVILLNDIASGLYFAQIYSENASVVKRIVKK